MTSKYMKSYDRYIWELRGGVHVVCVCREFFENGTSTKARIPGTERASDF